MPRMARSATAGAVARRGARTAARRSGTAAESRRATARRTACPRPAAVARTTVLTLPPCPAAPPPPAPLVPAAPPWPAPPSPTSPRRRAKRRRRRWIRHWPRHGGSKPRSSSCTSMGWRRSAARTTARCRRRRRRSRRRSRRRASAPHEPARTPRDHRARRIGLTRRSAARRRTTPGVAVRDRGDVPLEIEIAVRQLCALVAAAALRPDPARATRRGAGVGAVVRVDGRRHRGRAPRVRRDPVNEARAGNGLRPQMSAAAATAGAPSATAKPTTTIRIETRAPHASTRGPL